MDPVIFQIWGEQKAELTFYNMQDLHSVTMLYCKQSSEIVKLMQSISSGIAKLGHTWVYPPAT